MQNNKRKIGVVMLIIGIVLSLSGATYAYLRINRKQTNKNVYSSLECLDVSLINEENDISVNSAYAITDEEGMKQAPYKFTIKNNCSTDVILDINLENLSLSDETKRLSNDFLKVKLNSGDNNINVTKLLSEYDDAAVTLNNAVSSKNLTSNYYLAGNDSASFELRLWIDEETTAEEGLNKTYEGKIVISSAPTGKAPIYLEFDNKSENITLSKVLPQSDPIITKTFKVIGDTSNIAEDKMIIYKVNLVIDENTYDGLALNYCLNGENISGNGYLMPNISLAYLGEDNYNLGEGIFKPKKTSEHEYTLKVRLSDVRLSTTEILASKLNAHLELTYEIVPKEPNGYSTAKEGTLLAGIKTNYPEIMQVLTSPGKEVSLSEEAVMGATTDDYGTSYYFRGNVQNNYVAFAGMCWRIVRITGDGSIKLTLYNYSSDDCNAGGNTLAFARYNGTTYTTAFNTSYNDNAYIGFMYGTAGASTYEETHANINKSTILTNLETWYESNLSSYQNYLADTIWCNDKSTLKNAQTMEYEITTSNILNITDNKTWPGDGYGKTSYTRYSGGQRIRGTQIFKNSDNTKRAPAGTGPNLICPNDNVGGKLSKFTAYDTLNGNGALDYKIGLLTADELMYGGIIDYYVNGTSGYLNKTLTSYLDIWENDVNIKYWLLTPNAYFHQNVAMNFHGSIDNEYVSRKFGLRPAISLKSTAVISSGNGTSSQPFIISQKYYSD